MRDEALKLALEVLQINLTLLEKINPYKGQEDLLSDSLDLTHKAITAIKQALAAQPAPVQPVALDVTIDGDEAKALYDLMGDDREDLSPVRLLVGDGHSGYGLYVALAEYQDEGAELIASITPPAQPAPTVQERCEYCDGTGDVHDRTGEWRGVCNCEAGKRLAAPVQEPVALIRTWYKNGDQHAELVNWGTALQFLPDGGHCLYTTPPAAAVQEGRDWSLLEATQESLREHMAEIKRLKAAQPAVPDAMTSADIQEHIEYVAGWNECRQAMLEMMK
jgi:hypothetical protein